jgi:hypothetical protein
LGELPRHHGIRFPLNAGGDPSKYR